MPKPYTDEELLDEIQRLADDLGHTPSKEDMNAASEYPSVYRFRKHFDTWTAAVEAAGLESQQQRYTAEGLLNSLRNLADELGHSPTMREMNEAEGYPSASPYQNWFGSWNDALEAAGLETNLSHEDYSDQELLDLLRDLADEVGHPPSYDEMNNTDGYPGVQTYKRHFGSWTAAKEAAGFQETNFNPNYDRKELLDLLQELADELGRTPKRDDIADADGLPSVSTYQNHFGPWNKAVEAAGLDLHQSRPNYTEEELLERLQDLADELGHSPTVHEMNMADGYPVARTYRSHFDTWANAKEKAGLEIHPGDHTPDGKAKMPEGHGPTTKEALLNSLQDLADELGYPPSQIEMASATNYPSLAEYHAQFDSWEAAKEAAGLGDS